VDEDEMSRRTLVYFVCSPHSRTGVTTTARLITDYYLSRGIEVDCYDTDSREPSYALRYPDLSKVVDIFGIQGQIALFDPLLVPDERPKVVDVWSRSYDEFFAAIAEIGFLEEAARRGVEPIVFYQSDASAMAASNARLLTTTWPNLRVTVVHNEGASPLGMQARGLLAAYQARGKLVIPRLDRLIARELDGLDLSFSHLLRDSPTAMSGAVQAALKGWLAPIFTQLQSFELRIHLQSSQFLS
jgi:hypothetical protein